MKKIICSVLIFAMLLSLVIVLAGCEDDSMLRYGKRYTFESNNQHLSTYPVEVMEKTHIKNTFVFNSDKTGELTFYECITKESTSSHSTFEEVQEGTIKFKCRWCDKEKSAIYIFETERIAGDIEPESFSISNYPFIVGEDFIAPTQGSPYILEDSDIYGVENEIKKKEINEKYPNS